MQSGEFERYRILHGVVPGIRSSGLKWAASISEPRIVTLRTGVSIDRRCAGADNAPATGRSLLSRNTCSPAGLALLHCEERRERPSSCRVAAWPIGDASTLDSSDRSSATRGDHDGDSRAHTEVGFCTGVSAGGESGRHQRCDGRGVASGHDRIGACSHARLERQPRVAVRADDPHAGLIRYPATRFWRLRQLP